MSKNNVIFVQNFYTEISLDLFHNLFQYIFSVIGQNVPATSWGWIRGPNGLTPKLTTQKAAPPELLKLVSCKCEKGCGRLCGCRKGGLKCSEICYICHGRTCTNVKEFEVDDSEDDDERDTVQTNLLNAENDIFGEPQDLYLEEHNEEADPNEEAETNEEANPEPANLSDEIADENLDPSENISPSNRPSRRKRRRIFDDK